MIRPIIEPVYHKQRTHVHLGAPVSGQGGGLVVVDDIAVQLPDLGVPDGSVGEHCGEKSAERE